MNGYWGYATHLIRFDLAGDNVVSDPGTDTQGQKTKGWRLTQQQDLDRLGVFASDPLLVDLFIYSVRPLLCFLLGSDPVLLVVLGFVGRWDEEVGERVVRGGS